jgi:hypothetical protein
MKYQVTLRNVETTEETLVGCVGAPDAREALMDRRLTLPEWADGQPIHHTRHHCVPGDVAWIINPDNHLEFVNAEI